MREENGFKNSYNYINSVISLKNQQIFTSKKKNKLSKPIALKNRKENSLNKAVKERKIKSKSF